MFLLFLLIASVLRSINAVQCSLPIENSLFDAKINGLAAVVINSTHILYERAFGYNGPPTSNERQPIDTSKSIFVLASISKTFIAVAVMQLVELNKLDLDKNINEYLPSSMKIIHPLYPNIPITMRHVLTHRSGIGPNFDQEMKHFMLNDDFTKTNLSYVVLSYISNKANWLSEPPGITFHYSNIGATLAALIVEQITQISFEQYVHEKIFKPIGIQKNDASYRLSDFENRKEDLIKHYIYNASLLEQTQKMWPQLNITRVDNSSEWLYIPYFSVTDYPAGLLRMSAHTLARYLQSFLNNFPTILRNSSSIDELIRVQLDVSKEFQMALLWYWKIFDGRRFVGHEGGMPGIMTKMMSNDKRTLGVVILSNADATAGDDLAKPMEDAIAALMIQLFNCFE